MEIPNVKGLDQLHQAVSEALEIEKCSICLETLENTVLLWPCTHWFCYKCISTLHQSSKGEKINCPLCKCATTRRKVLPFQDKQTEYQDLLQTLIGALSLDLKFDVTSYNPKKCENFTSNILTKTEKTEERSIKTRTSKKIKEKAPVRLINVQTKHDSKNKKRFTRKSENLNPTETNKITVRNNGTSLMKSPNSSPALLPETPDNLKEKKVKVWLESNKFSQVDQDVCTDTIVADIHNAEQNESLCFSESALQSVSQIDYKNIQTPSKPKPSKKILDTPSDINAIKVCNLSQEKSSSRGTLDKNLKCNVVPAADKFDELFPENKKLRSVTTTYGSKNPLTSGRSRTRQFAVQDDLFKSIDEDEGSIEKSDQKDLSEETFEDFSSGSGEEWTIEKRSRKRKVMDKGIALKKNVKETIKRNVKTCRENCESDKLNNRSTRNFNQLCQNTNKSVHRDFFRKSNPTSSKSIIVKEFIKPKDKIVKEIVDDWNDTKDSNNLSLACNLQSTKANINTVTESCCDGISDKVSENNFSELTKPNPLANIENKVVNTPCKEVNSRSPGWSRLKSTKKEFHLSEKKKLKLKTLNKSNSSIASIGISPLLNNNKNLMKSNACIASAKPTTDQPDNNVPVVKDKDSSKSNIESKTSDHDFDIPCHMVIGKSPELGKTLNTSHNSSASGSPFRGFPDGKERKCSELRVSLNDQIDGTLGFKSSNYSCELQSDKVSVTLSKSHQSETMEIDEHLKSKLQCSKENKQNIVDPSEVNEKSCNPEENSTVLQANNAVVVSPQETNKCTVFSKKRDRDSGIHNESGLSSPLRKRVCMDAEVQTSPSRMESAVRDMLRDLCGMELEEIIKHSNHKDIQEKINPPVITNPDKCCPGLSQDSDKENFNINSKNINSFNNSFNDSDIVYGTEDDAGINRVNTFGLNDMNTLDCDFANPNLPTQPYKTPVVQRKPLKTSTEGCYTVVSNPSLSELKRTDSVFDKSDVIFPDETPKGEIFWNDSGVNQLECNTGSVKKTCIENHIPNLSQNMKGITNRSRRQLDFVQESSNDIFEFDKQGSSKLTEGAINDKSYSNAHCEEVEQIFEKTDGLDDIFMQDNELIEGALSSPDKEKEGSTCNKNMVLYEHQNAEVRSEILPDTSGMVGSSDKKLFNEVDFSKEEIQNKAGYDDTTDTVGPKAYSQKTIEETNKNPQIQKLTKEDLKDQSVLQLNNSFLPRDFPSPDNQVRTEQSVTSFSCVNSKEVDEESNNSSDVSFVEGTPDVSQSHEHEKETSGVENCSETRGLKSVNPYGGDVSKDEISKIDAFLPTEPSHKNVILMTEEKLPEKSSETIFDIPSVSNQMNENSEVQVENLCFASSLLNQQQNQVLACVLGGMGLAYSKSVDQNISHLIVGTKNGCFQNTYKVLLAMALHKPIIRFDWVEEVIRTGGTVPLDPFLALDPSGECGVLRAKADKGRKLLQSFAVHIYNVNDRIILKEQIEELVRLCGGIVVKELHSFNEIPRDKFRVIVLSEPPDSLTQGDWRQKYSAVEVMIDWIYNTIGRYRVMPLVPFMVTEPADAVPFLLHEGYPKELIFDMSMRE